MPVNIDDKLRMFRSLLMEKIHEENEAEIAKLSKIYDQELTSSQNKIHLQAVRILEEAEATSKIEVRNQKQKAVTERNKQILFQRRQFMEELSVLLREKTAEMPEEIKSHYLIDSLQKAEKMFKQENTLIIKAEADDIDTVSSLLEQMKQENKLQKNYTIQESSIGGLGGIVIENESATLRADFSINSFLEEHKELIGRRMQARLSEVMNIELQ